MFPRILCLCLVAGGSALSRIPAPDGDKYEWLEDVAGERSLEWVRGQNARTRQALGDPARSRLLSRALGALASKRQVPWPVEAHGGQLYHLWQDSERPRGLWRRTSPSEYRKRRPKWEVMLNVDSLASADASWVFRDCVFLEGGSQQPMDSCLMLLSRGGADAVEVREFNLTTKKFEPPPRGFFVPEGKTIIQYRDRDSVYVGTSAGAGALTDSGYPRTIREWHRGDSLDRAQAVHEGDAHDLLVSVERLYERHGFVYDWRVTQTSFFASVQSVRVVSAGAGEHDDEFHELDVPHDAEVFVFADQMLLKLDSDYEPAPGTLLPKGSLVATPLAAFLGGQRKEWTSLFRPTEQQSLQRVEKTRSYVVLSILQSMQPSLTSWHYAENGTWSIQQKVRQAASSVRLRACDGQATDALFVSEGGFLMPTRVSLVATAGNLGDSTMLRSWPAMFDASDLDVSQRWATSDDGTSVPYYLVKHTKSSKKHPTLLYGYGGFDKSLTPQYSPVLGRAWLEHGGTFALANVRGGGEFGPAWHHAAQRQHKERSYQDMAAVARDLVATNVTSKQQLGLMGSSNGGLLAGYMYVKYPELFGAVVSKVPLLDLRRFKGMLDGPFYVEEYGDPDNASDWEYMRQLSPYHLLDTKKAYPPALFMTSTTDDRVSPAHARKMVMKIQQEVPKAGPATFLYEDGEGGHEGGSARQQAERYAMQYEFLSWALGLGKGSAAFSRATFEP